MKLDKNLRRAISPLLEEAHKGRGIHLHLTLECAAPSHERLMGFNKAYGMPPFNKGAYEVSPNCSGSDPSFSGEGPRSSINCHDPLLTACK